jgi:hypothetical protein
MRATTDRKKVIRLTVLALSLAGLTVAAAAFLRFVKSVAANAVEGGPALIRYPEYYRQIGAYYARGFTTGFFVCYFLMLFAMIVGSWVDEKRRARRDARAAEPAVRETATPPALAGEPAVPE